MSKSWKASLVLVLAIFACADCALAQSTDDKDKPCHKDSSGVCTTINVPFIPQTSTTQQMLAGIRLANEERAARQRAAQSQNAVTVPAVTPAQTAPAQQTEGLARNGTGWMQLQSAAKSNYITGFMDGMVTGVLATGSTKFPNAFQRADGFVPTSAEIVIGVDALYSKPENLPICIGDAVTVEWLSLTGNQPGESAIKELREGDGKAGCN